MIMKLLRTLLALVSAVLCYKTFGGLIDLTVGLDKSIFLHSSLTGEVINAPFYACVSFFIHGLVWGLPSVLIAMLVTVEHRKEVTITSAILVGSLIIFEGSLFNGVVFTATLASITVLLISQYFICPRLDDYRAKLYALADSVDVLNKEKKQ